MSSNRS